MEHTILGIIRRNINTAGCLFEHERSVFRKILSCRTESVPFLYMRCDACSTVHPVYASCKDRMCPICNSAAPLKWAAQREAELLPTKYFLLTFTVPSQLRPLFLANKRTCYDLLFKAAARSLTEGARNNDRDFHGRAGFFGMLHTWDQRMNYHPHLHIVVPAGCLSDDGTAWVHSNSSFFLPVKKLSADFRKKLLSSLARKYKSGKLYVPDGTINPAALFEKLKAMQWVVHSRPPHEKGGSEPMVRYLSRYVAKSAISEQRIKDAGNGTVRLAYYDRKNKLPKTETITEEQFLSRMALHILPRGFKKVRFFGFMANRHRAAKLILCRMLLGTSLADQEEQSKALIADTAFLFWKYFKIDITLCKDCGKGHVRLVRCAFTTGAP